jgi:hypothetical protein
MRRLLRATIACSALGAGLPGCTGVLTQSAVTGFARSLEAKDLTGLKGHTSKRFEEHALRLPESVQDLSLLKLPTGKARVVSIEDKGRDERIVQVEVGESKRKIEYHLRREGRRGKWVVDDLMVSQISGDKSISRSVTDQMNLLLSVRELMTDWQSGDRSRILANAMPELAADMNDLPPAWMDQVAKRVSGDGPMRSFRPDARMQDDKAVVGLTRGDNSLMLEFKQAEGRWLLLDASWKGGDDEDVRSLRKLSVALTHARRFLEAYAAEDQSALATLTTSGFYSSLEGAELEQASIPVVDLMTRPYQCRQNRQRVDVLLSDDSTTYTLNIVAADSKADGTESDGKSAEEARVEELTIYDREEGQVKRLSSMFQAQAVVEIFGEMLATRDPAQLRQLSTTDFNEQVWRRFSPAVLGEIALPEIEAAAPQIISTVFQGPVTEVTVRQGAWNLTYVLHTEGGRLVVDDILMPTLNRPSSFKKHLQLLGPIHEFAQGLRKQDNQALLAASGPGLDRIVWRQVRETPDIGIDLVDRMTLPVQGMQVGDTQSRVTLSDGQRVAEISLEDERGRFVVSDVNFIERPDRPAVAMLQAMRHQIAREMQSRNSNEILQGSGEIIQTAHETVEGAPNRVQPL